MNLSFRMQSIHQHEMTGHPIKYMGKMLVPSKDTVKTHTLKRKSPATSQLEMLNSDI